MSDERESLFASCSPSAPESHSGLPLPRDAPTAYETILSLLKGHSQNTIRLPESPTTNPSFTNHHATVSPPSFQAILPSIKGGHVRSLSSSSASSLKGKAWFPFSSSSASTTPAGHRKPNNEVRTTVLNLVRDLVQDHSSGSPAALGILQSCADACTAHNVSLSAILQEKFIEGHSPLYWAIVKREEADAHEDIRGPDLLDALLKQASPLDSDTVVDLRQACLATSDHSMFQRLSVHFTTTSGADKVILGAALPPDSVTVEIGSGNEGAFAVNFQIFQFHKRMMISKEIKHEFIARNRIWKFCFIISPPDARYGPPPGSWCVSLSLQESSPPTWFDGRLVLPNSNQPLRLRSKQMMEGTRNDITATQLVVPMDNSPHFATLQYSGSSFVPDDERLMVRLEAKLRRSDPTTDD